jgi:hypothetical protein
VYGRIRNIHGKGPAAKYVFEILKIKEQEYKIEVADGDIEHLVIFDRSVDLLTPLLKPFTYEAMIDEVYGNVCGFANIPKAQPARNAEQQFDKVPMNMEKDSLYG